MKQLDEDIGRIYHKNDFYYLEKVFEDLVTLYEEETMIKARAKSHGFKIIKTSWAIEENPYYHIETVINDYNTDGLDPLRYVFKVKLKYLK